MKLTYQKAVDALVSLIEMQKMSLPVSASLPLARLIRDISNEIKPFQDVRNALLQKYAIKATHAEAEETLTFTVKSDESQDEKKTKLEEFMHDLEQLLLEETGDIPEYRILLPADIRIKAQTLRPIADFVEVE